MRFFFSVCVVTGKPGNFLNAPGDGRDAGLSDARVDGREQRAAVPCVVHSGLVPAHTGLLALFESTLAVAFY